MLEGLFNSHKTYTANIQSLTQSHNTDGTLGAKSWSTTKSVTCLFWRGGLAKSIVGEKNKLEVTASIIVQPEDINLSEIPVTGRVQIMDGSTQIGIFAIISPDNIGGQDKVIIIPMKEFT